MFSTNRCDNSVLPMTQQAEKPKKLSEIIGTI